MPSSRTSRLLMAGYMTISDWRRSASAVGRRCAQTVLDARYLEFRAAISKEQKGGNFALDTAILGASALGAVVKGAANEFSAAAAALTGTRSSLNREVYFERTLPAIIKTMEASRIRVRAQIVQYLRADDIATYPLEQAFADITLYQLSTTIGGAIQEVTEAAGKAADAEIMKVENAIESCGPTDEIGAYWRRINVYAGRPAKRHCEWRTSRGLS